MGLDDFEIYWRMIYVGHLLSNTCLSFFSDLFIFSHPPSSVWKIETRLQHFRRCRRSTFTFIKRLFSSPSLSAIRLVSSAYLRLLIFLLAILIPACVSSSPAILMMYSAYKLNKQRQYTALMYSFSYLEPSESREWKSWLKAQHSENEDHGIWSHHFMGNRWGNNGNSIRLYFFGFQNHCRWWLQPWN